jgi:putative methyltransferase (TIGR04325 family)
MKEAAKKIARTPPVLALRRAWQRMFSPRWFQGSYESWSQARSASAGYDEASILERVRAAGRAVKTGRAAWDRDGVTFAEPAVHAPLLAVLGTIARERMGRLDLVDFGGGLGSTWRQHRPALADLAVHWCVVEQAHVVAAGREEFTGEGLSFEPTLAAAVARVSPSVVLFSSVLQYLEKPWEVLAEAVATSGVRHIIIDRLPLWSGKGDWLTVQRTPRDLGGGGYPAWVFSRTSILAPLNDRFECVAEWPGFDDVDRRVTYHGFHFSRKEVA